MRYAQIVLLEAPGGCNLTDRHPECPAGVLGRARAARYPMAPSRAVGIALELAGLGFCGFWAFHWFSEPMTARPWVEAVMAGIRDALPGARFLLWTNGTLLGPETWPFVAGFDSIFLSNYDGSDRSELQALCGPRLFVWEEPVMEPRMMMPPDPEGREGSPVCRRPYTEFTITRDGDVPLCCQAWRPEQRLGNVFADGLAACVERYQLARAAAARYGARPEAPAPCRGCARPEPVIGRTEPVIAEEALRANP